MGWERIIKIFKKERYIPDESKWRDDYRDGSFDSKDAINIAYDYKLERYLTWMDPKSLAAMSREIDKAKQKFFSKSIKYFVIAIFLSWLVGYEDCRSRVEYFFEPASIEYYCKLYDGVGASMEISKAIKKFLSPF
ncbi:hypothetical protein [Solidesulfovibrio sp.]|uniref:hypothetical protein n=1 Tax=Solidesulfovibrio sp. TaxID=2910990 RepID=UPI002639C334|nr:hypothetical protein [Solidesulfovibrio sp.]